MERGEEKQTKVTDVFSDDKKFYALVEIEPLIDKLVETHKRFERRSPELIEEITRKGDDIDLLIGKLEKDFGHWEKNTTYGEMVDSPSFHLVRNTTVSAVEALDSMKSLQKGELYLLRELTTFSNTLESLLNSIATIVEKQDSRIKFLEAEQEFFFAVRDGERPVMR